MINLSYLESTKYTLDWLQGVLPFSDVRQLFKALGDIDERLKFVNWSIMGNLRNYRTRFICQGKPSFSIAYNDDPLQDPYNKKLWYSSDTNDDVSLIAEDHPFNPGIFVSISGDGLRWLNQEPNTVKKILEYFRLQKFKCSRIDFACDIFESNNDLVPTVIKSFKNAVVRQGNRFCIRSNISRTSGKNGSVRLFQYDDIIRCPDKPKKIYNVEFGNHGSSFGMFRCYDKWFEIASGRLSGYKSDMLDSLSEPYWYRLEYELHNGKTVERAAEIFNLLADAELDVKSAWGWCAANMFDVIKLDYRSQKLERSFVPTVWSQLIEYTIHFVQLNLELVSTPWVEKSPEKFKHWIRNCKKAFAKAKRIFESDPDFYDEIMSEGMEKYTRDVVAYNALESWIKFNCCTT